MERDCATRIETSVARQPWRFITILFATTAFLALGSAAMASEGWEGNTRPLRSRVGSARAEAIAGLRDSVAANSTKADESITNLGVLEWHPYQVNAVAVRPDSKFVAVGLISGTLGIYSLEETTRAPLEIELRRPISAVKFDPSGRRLVATTWDKAIHLIDAATFKEIDAPTAPSLVLRAEFSNDGNTLYAVTLDGMLLRINVGAKLEMTNRVPLAKQIDEAVLAISPDGSTLAAAVTIPTDGSGAAKNEHAGEIQLLRAGDLHLIHNWKGHEVNVSGLAFDCDGGLLASGDIDGKIKIWSRDGEKKSEPELRHQAAVTGLAFANDGRLVSVGEEGLCQIWAPATFAPQQSLTSYRGYFTSVAMSPDEKWLVRAGSSLEFVPWNRMTSPILVRDCTGTIVALAVDSGRKLIATGSYDRTVGLSKIDGPHVSIDLPDWATALALTTGGESMAVGLGNGGIQLFSADTRKPEGSWSAHAGVVTGVAFVGDQIASAGADGDLNVWDRSGHRVAGTAIDSPARSMTVFGANVAVGASNGLIVIYDTEHRTKLLATRPRPFSVTALQFAPDGKELLAGYFDGALAAVDARSGTSRTVRPGEGASLLALDFNAKGDLLVAGFRDGSVLLLDGRTKALVATAPRRSGLEVFCAKFLSLDDATFATAGGGSTCSLFRYKR